MGHFLKSLLEFVTILLLFFVLISWPQGMWDLSSWTRDRTRAPCTGRQSPSHWTTREVLLWQTFEAPTSQLWNWLLPATLRGRAVSQGNTSAFQNWNSRAFLNNSGPYFCVNLLCKSNSFFKICLFLIGGTFSYSFVLVSAIHNVNQ